MKSDKKLDLGLLASKLGYDLGLSDRDITTLAVRYSNEGLRFLTVALPTLGKALDHGLSSGKFKLPAAFFKRSSRHSEIPAFCGSLFIEVFRHDGSLRQNPDVFLIENLRLLLFFFYKVKSEYKEEQKNRIIRNFVETEYEVKTYNQLMQNMDWPVLDIASLLVDHLFGDFNPNVVVGKHGAGATSNCKVTEKYTKRLEKNLPVYIDYGKEFFFNASHAQEIDRYPAAQHTFDLFRTEGNRAKVILVPKDSRGPRLISCEPVENMFVQQGIMSWMVERLESHVLTKNHVNFTDQSVNQRLAFKGSYGKGFATLDLKDASDRVSLGLVARLFGNTPLFRSLMLSRSQETVLPDGTIHKMEKFAPMGSALCFPVMATCIYVLIVAQLIYQGLSVERAMHSVFVYGDDIIVHESLADDAIVTLEDAGLKVNRDKSFLSGSFRESCGHDYFDGHLVTPTRLRTCEQPEKKNPQALVSLLSTANQLRLRGCSLSSDYLFTQLERVLGPLPYGTDSSPFLCIVEQEEHRVSMLNSEKFSRAKAMVKREGDLWKFPFGRSYILWAKCPVNVRVRETGYSRLQRTHSIVGKGIPLPRYGYMAKPQSIRLKRKRFSLI